MSKLNDQRPTSAEEELQKALSDCRDVFPIPDQGSELEQLWSSAMADPLSVPAYVKAYVAKMAPSNKMLMICEPVPTGTYNSHKSRKFRLP